MWFRLLRIVVLLGWIRFYLAAQPMFEGAFLRDAPPTIVSGTIRVLLVRNPHSFVMIADDKLKDSVGEPIRWSVQWGAAGQLARQGIKSESFKVGDHVIVTGIPRRNPEEHWLRLHSIERTSDGLKYP